MDKDVSNAITRYEDEILEDVIRLIRIPSVRGPESAGKPFGDGPAKALDYCLGLGRGLGFRVKNCRNYAGHIEYGEGDGLLGVLAHVDVVPAGEGWTMQPFGGEMKDERVYGRGAMDDKSEAVAAIYCLKALKDRGIVPKMRIRVILGAGEETGMEDMQEYFRTEEMPDYGFTPDSEYPVCNREKGILRVEILGKCGEASLTKFEAGTAPNMVPASAWAVLAGREDAEELEDCAKKYDPVRFAVQKGEDGLNIRCYGKAAHASTPQMGVNSAAYLLKLLAECGCFSQDEGFFAFLARCVGLDFTGGSLGIGCRDEESGILTMNLGVVRADENGASAVLDIRYPVTMNSKAITEQIRETAGKYGLRVGAVSDNPPLFIPEDSPLVVKLLKAYATVMKQKAGTYSTGGGTYARSLCNRGVAFGAGFRDLSFYNIHSADEFLVRSEFMNHCRVSLQAMYEIACDTGLPGKVHG